MEIHLVLTDDWELRGDGSGNMRRLQFDQMQQLRTIYEENGLRGTFNVEVMQQLSHRKAGETNAGLRALADEWEQLVTETYKRGHDVQLHVHPQWSETSFEDGQWRLAGDWSITNYSREDTRHMLESAKNYLEELLRKADPQYRCVAFRGGGWAIAPGDHVLDTLADLGIVFDMSIVGGLRFDMDVLKLDYRDVEESFFPFYPNMRDARRVSADVEPIICCPTHSFEYVRGLFWETAAIVLNRLNEELYGYFFNRPNQTPVAGDGVDSDYSIWIEDTVPETHEAPGRGGFRKKMRTYLNDAYSRAFRISDISVLNLIETRNMIRDIRRRARAGRIESIPIILENHTKDIGDFGPIEHFCRWLARQRDIRVLTAVEVADNLIAGKYAIKRAGNE